MDEAVESWAKTARDDWGAAEAMFSTGRWSHAVFLCHECLEKLLKALYVQKKSSLPPTTHNLSQLLQKLGLNPSQQIWDRLYDVSPHYAVTRYPEVAGGAPSENYNQATAERLMAATREVKAWLEQHLK
jgi:HEPN domain-containing protein